MKNKKMDKVGFASTMVMSFSMLYLILEIIVKLTSHVKIENLTWEFVLLFSMLFLFLLLSRDEIALNVPRSLIGKLLPLANNKKKSRSTQYLKESMLVSFLIVVAYVFVYAVASDGSKIILLNLVNNFEIYNLVVNAILLFILSTILIFSFDYYICERNISLYLDYIKFLSINKEKEKDKVKTVKTYSKKNNK